MNLIITPESFLKTAKRLQKNLPETLLEYSPEQSNNATNHTTSDKITAKDMRADMSQELSLSQSQELLAKSLGFRNYHALFEYFKKSQDSLVDNASVPVGNNPNNHNPDDTNMHNSSTTGYATGYIRQEGLGVYKMNHHTPRNILETLDEDQIRILIFSLMDRTIDGSHNMWLERAQAMIWPVLMVLQYLRQQKEIVLDIKSIREYMVFENLLNLYNSRTDIPQHIRTHLAGYLLSLPGFNKSSSKQNDTVIEQHGYFAMQFTKPLLILERIELLDVALIPSEIVKIIKNDSINNIKPHLEPDSTDSTSKMLQKNMMIYLEENWENFELSNFFSVPMRDLIKKNKSKISGALYLSDILILAMNYIDEQKRRHICEMAIELSENIHIVKKYSNELFAMVNKNHVR